MITSIEINILILKKFPNVVYHEFAEAIIRERNQGNLLELKEDIVDALTYYKELKENKEKIAELLKKISESEIEALRKNQFQLIENKLFHHDKMKADYSLWNKKPSWTVEECLALTFRKNPRIINYYYATKWRNHSTGLHLEYTTLPFVDKYDELFDSIKRSIELGILKTISIDNSKNLQSKKIAKDDYIKWANKYWEKLPSEILDDIGIEDDYKLIKIKLDEIGNKNVLLTEELKQKEDQIKELEKENLNIISKRSLLKMIYGMAISKYGWNPDVSKSPTTSKITKDVNHVWERDDKKNAISDDCVREWLKAAKELMKSQKIEN